MQAAINGANNRTEYAYNLAGDLTQLTQVYSPTDPLLNRVTTYTYDQLGRQDKIIYPGGAFSQTFYDDAGRTLQSIDEMGQTTVYEYDAAGRLARILQAPGTADESVTQYIYNTFGQRSEVIDPRNFSTTYAYDSAGRLAELTQVNPAGLNRTTCYAYTLFGEMESVTRACGTDHEQTTTYQYNSRGWQVRTIYPDLTETETVYNAAGQIGDVFSQHDNTFAGTQTRYLYDLYTGDLSTVIQDFTGIQATTSYTYNPAGQQDTLTDPLGNITSYNYDAAGRMELMTRAAGTPAESQTQYQYNGFGELAQITQGFGSSDAYTLTYAYNDRGWQTDVFYPLHPDFGVTSDHTEYYDNGQILSVTDQGGQQTAYSYDPLGRLASVTLAAGTGGTTERTVSYDYDPTGNLITLTDAAHPNNPYSYQYNAFDEQTIKTWPDGSQEFMEYDDLGNLVSHTLPDTVTPSTLINTFEYDNMNRLETATYFDGKSTHYEYRPDGLTHSVAEMVGTTVLSSTVYGYDTLFRPTQIVQPDAVLDYEYDTAGNRTSMMVTPDLGTAWTVSYEYDAAQRLENVITHQGTTHYTYNALDLLTQTQLPNSITSTYTYDSLLRLTELEHTSPAGTLADYTYVYDAVGNRRQIVELDNSRTEWGYDAAYRLVSEQRFDPSNASTYNATFQYDRAGNRTQAIMDGVQADYSYNELDQLESLTITENGTTLGTLYTYDPRGNLTTITAPEGNTTYAYDARDRLVRAELPDNSQIAYAYDHQGQRLEQNIDGQVTNYAWDELSTYGDVIAELDNNGAVTTRYVLGNNRLIFQEQGSTPSYYLADAQGSTRALANSAGSVTDSYAYTAFGELYAQTGTTANNYLYTGQQFDSATGLYSLRARYYHPSLGRFFSRDTFAINHYSPFELNRYVYGINNPLGYFDPSGHSALTETGIGNALRGAVSPVISFFGNSAARIYVMALLRGMAVGTVLGAGFEIGKQKLIEHRTKIDWDRVAYSAFKGAVLGGISVVAGAALATKLNSALLVFVAGGTIDTIVGVVWDVLLEGRSVLDSLKWNAFGNFVIGGVAALLGWAMKSGWRYWRGTPDAGAPGGAGGSSSGGSSGDDIQGGTGGGSGDDGLGGTGGSGDEVQGGTGGKGGDEIEGTGQQKGNGGDEDGTGGGVGKGCLNSFSGGTTVATENGEVPIREIRVGDKVYAYNEETGEIDSYTVTATISHTDETVVELTIGDETLTTTLEHPFYTAMGHWVEAEDLEIGDWIYSAEYGYGRVNAIEIVDDSQPMYNLTVDEAHTFFVGEGQWLVHNTDDCWLGPKPTGLQDPDLKDLVDDDFRFQSSTRNGGTADAVNNEAATGNSTGGKWHVEKSHNLAVAYQRWINTHPDANAGDIQIAQALVATHSAAVQNYNYNVGSMPSGAPNATQAQFWVNNLIKHGIIK